MEENREIEIDLRKVFMMLSKKSGNNTYYFIYRSSTFRLRYKFAYQAEIHGRCKFLCKQTITTTLSAQQEP